MPGTMDFYTDGVAITPHNSTNFSQGECRGIYVGGAGNLVVVKPNGSTVTITGALAGTIIPIKAIRVNSTSTTATNLVALY
jgi:hypothetical protein